MRMVENTFLALKKAIEQREYAVAGLRPGTASQLYFVDQKNPQKTPLAVLYLHGFSASPEEVRPLPDQLAAALGANLYMPRLTGHGLNGEALALAKPAQWYANVKAAFKVSSQLGDRVIVVGTSTGAPLALWLALQKPKQLAALLLISPNFATRDARGEWLRKRWGRLLFRAVRGPFHGIEPLSAGHSRYWTTFFPVIAVRNLLQLVADVRGSDFSGIKLPTFIAYSKADKVVNAEWIEQKFDELGAKLKRLLPVENSTDPLQHVIVGDIRSANTTGQVVDEILEFLRQAGIAAPASEAKA